MESVRDWTWEELALNMISLSHIFIFYIRIYIFIYVYYLYFKEGILIAGNGTVETVGPTWDALSECSQECVAAGSFITASVCTFCAADAVPSALPA